jgi:hypothetical protein
MLGNVERWGVSHTANHGRSALIPPKNDGGMPTPTCSERRPVPSSLASGCSPLTELAVGKGTDIRGCRAIVFRHLRSLPPPPNGNQCPWSLKQQQMDGLGGGHGRRTFAIRGAWWESLPGIICTSILFAIKEEGDRQGGRSHPRQCICNTAS